MVEALFWFVVGLIVGWNFVPQPDWIKNAVSKTVNYVKGLFK